MTVSATPLLTGLPATLPAQLGAGHGWERCLVVLLHLARDVSRKDRLEPLSGATADDPSVRCGYRASKASGKSGGTQGKAFVPCHAWILPRKIKCAMRKINLAMGYAMRKMRPCKRQWTSNHGSGDATRLLIPATWATTANRSAAQANQGRVTAAGGQSKSTQNATTQKPESRP